MRIRSRTAMAWPNHGREGYYGWPAFILNDGDHDAFYYSSTLQAPNPRILTNSFHDVVGNNWRYNDCRHYRRTSYNKPNTVGVVDNSECLNIYQCPPSGPNKLSQLVKGYPVQSLVRCASEYNRVGCDMTMSIFTNGFTSPILPWEIHITKDVFDTNFSIWYLVADLLDLKGPVQRILSKRRSLDPRWYRNRQFLKELDKPMSKVAPHNLNLAVQFGVLPTIADVEDFLTLVFKWREVYDHMDEALKGPFFWRQHRHDVCCQLREAEYPDRTVIHTVQLNGQLYRLKSIERNTIEFHRTARFHASAPEFKGWISRLKQFADAFGVFDFAAVWDVIPFSFVVDWFFNIGRWLHQNRPKLYPCDIIIDDYCESIRLDTDIEWRLMDYWGVDNWLPGPPYSYRPDDLICSEHVTQYVRKRFRPPANTVSLPRLAKSVLSCRRVGIASSLIAQRLPRH